MLRAFMSEFIDEFLLHVIALYGAVRAPGLKESTRSVSWLDVVKGDYSRFYLSLSMVFVCCCLRWPLFGIVSLRWYVFGLLVVLVVSIDWKKLLRGSLIVARGSSPQSQGQREFMIFLV